MKLSLLKILGLFFVIALAAIWFKRAGIGSFANEPSKAGVLSFARPSEERFEPITGGIPDVVLSIYEPLYQYGYLSLPPTPEPLLAKSLPRISQDGLTLTIEIKKGIHFADDPCFHASQGKGREIKADDFVYSFKRLALPGIPEGWWILDKMIVGINAFHNSLAHLPREKLLKALYSPVDGIRALNDNTLQLKLLRPLPRFLYVLSMNYTAVVPHEAVEAYGDENGALIDHPVGSGPFRLGRQEKGRGFTLERNPSYHADFYPRKANAKYANLLGDQGKLLPMVNEIHYEFMREDLPTWLKFQKGELDIISLPKDIAPNLFNGTDLNISPEFSAKGYQVAVADPVETKYIALNMKDPLLGRNKYLRQALSSAINREAWGRLFGKGTSQVATGTLPPSVTDRPMLPHLKFDYNPERAKALLAKAGFPGGKGLPPIEIELGMGNTTNRQLGDFLSQQFNAIGIEILPILGGPGDFHKKKISGRYQSMYLGWAMDYPDPDNMYSLFYGPNGTPGPNASNFKNEEFDSLFQKMIAMPAGPSRAKLVSRLEEIVQEEVPWLTCIYSSDIKLTQARVKNFRFSETIWNWMKYVKLQ